MQIAELKGYKSLRAFNVFHTLMLGLKMLPAYLNESYEDFLDRIQGLDPEAQRKLIKEAALFVRLEKDEVEALICFAKDKLGVPYSSENLGNLSPGEILDIVVAVCFEISKIKVDFVTDTEKKN